MDQDRIELVIQAGSGNIASFSALYNLYCGKVYALVRSMVENEKDAEDIVQDTFIRAWRSIGTLLKPEAFSTWIQRIAHNRCRTYQQKRYKKILSEVALEAEENQDLLAGLEAEEASIPSVYVERDDLRQRMNEMINSLGDAKKQTFTLFYLNNMSVEEIAQIMECSENTVRSRLRLGRRAIQLKIEEWEEETGEVFYHAAGVPLLPFGEAISLAMQKDLLGQTASEAILSNILAEISQVPMSSTKDLTKGEGSVKNAVKRGAVSASKGPSVLVKVMVAVLAVELVGTGIYLAIQGNRSENMPVTAVDPVVTEAPLMDASNPGGIPSPTALDSADQPQQTDIPAPTDEPPADAFIVWADPHFEAAVRASMKIPEAPIAVSMAMGEKRLRLTLPQAVDLGDLKYFPNVESLELEGGGGTLDLSPLSGLAKLEELHIKGAQGSDWTKLGGLSALKWLSLENADLSHPTWLTKLTGLELLHFSHVNPFDLAILRGLPALESLQMTDCALADLTPLGSMTSLTWISVKNTSVSDLGPLADLPALKWLDISGTKVTDLSPVTHQPNPPYVVADGM